MFQFSQSYLDPRERLLIVGLAAPWPFLVERVFVGVVGHAELGEEASNDVPCGRVGVDVEALHSIGREVEWGERSSTTEFHFHALISQPYKNRVVELLKK